MNKATRVESLDLDGANASVYKVSLPTTTLMLKTTKSRLKDNLSYEHQAGLWVNSLRNDLFAKTFGFYSAPPGRVDLNFVRHLRPVHATPSNQCEPNENKYLAVEYFEGSDAELLLQIDPAFVHHLPRALFKIYNELSRIKDVFTHYDLHLGNILFGRDYTPKIIDFGRCHFPGASEVERRVCSVCEVCGVKEGYWFQPDGRAVSTSIDFYINPPAPNQSHDLLYLYQLKKKYGSVIRKRSPELFRLLNRVVYKDPGGTPELKCKGRHICDVTDAARALKHLIQKRTTSAGRTPARRTIRR